MRQFMTRILFFMIMTITSAGVLAQSTCPAIVNQALSAIGDNCTDLTRNNACYGYDLVATTFRAPRPPDFFSRPADQAELLELASIRTAPLDLETGRFGAAMMNVQANIPNSLPGQGVLFLLLGDTEVRNEVIPDAAFAPTDAINLRTVVPTSLLSAPARTANVRGSVAEGSLLSIDGTNTSREYLRALIEGGVAWVTASAVSDVPTSLPVVSGTQRTPMQAFYFNTGIGPAGCVEAEAVVAVQSPENFQVELTVNGVDIRVGSMITFRNQPDGTQTLTVHRGQVQTATGFINAGETGIAGTTDDGSSTGWTITREASPEELALGERVQENFNQVAEANGWPVRSLTAPTPPPSADGFERDEAGNIIHIVQAGETLFSIARLYDASMPAIAARNNLANPRAIFVGQRLLIPGAFSGFVGLPEDGTTAAVTTPADIPTTGVCAGFRHVSPLDAAVATDDTYSWTAVATATRYKLNFYDYTGAFSTSLFVEAPTTSLIVNVGQIPSGGALQWEVEALVGEQSICNTGRTSFLTRRADPNETIQNIQGSGQPPLTVSWSCAGGYYTMVWADALIGDGITLYYSDGVPQSRSAGTGQSGSYNDYGGPFTLTNAYVVASPSGRVGSLPSVNC